MAIYSLNHRSVGKSTHATGTAGAHIAYITRKDAAGAALAERMPQERHEARAWIDRAEANDRKNGRVCDKVMVALPRELDVEQRIELVSRFGHEATQGRGSWLAAIHDKGRDEGNPHAHFVIRDKDVETGKRVAGLSEKGSTERLRELWEGLANEGLGRAGHDARIDRRTLEAQGIGRKPQIHVGPRAKAMQERGVEPVSKSRHDRRGRWIQYYWIDFDVVKRRGRTRAEHNALIVRRNEQHAETRRRREAWQARERAEREAKERKAREDRAREAEVREAIREFCGIKPAGTRSAHEAGKTATAEFSGDAKPKSGDLETGVMENHDKRDGEAPTQEMSGGERSCLPGPRAQDSKKTALAGISPQEEFSAACLRYGLVIEGGPIMDGEWHAVPVAGDGVGEAKGMYRGSLGGEPSGTIANLRDGGTVEWTATDRAEAVAGVPGVREMGTGKAVPELEAKTAGLEPTRMEAKDGPKSEEKAGEQDTEKARNEVRWVIDAPRRGEFSRLWLRMASFGHAEVAADRMALEAVLKLDTSKNLAILGGK